MDKNVDTFTNSINIMLTPQFYTLKRESLPLKYTYQAQRIAPSLFEGLLEDVQNHKYFVSKEKDSWLFIAYDSEKIKSFLQSKGFNLADISKVYFSQQSAPMFTGPVLLGEKDALVNIDSIMTVVPQNILQDEEKPITFDARFTPKKGIVLEGRSSAMINSSEAYTLAAILALFAVIYFVEGSRYGGADKAQQEEIRLLLEEYPSLQSSYKRESIASKYKVIDKKERKKREVIKALSHMIFKGSTLNSLEIDDKKFQALFSCKNATVAKELQELAKKEKFNSTTLLNNNVRIEGTL